MYDAFISYSHAADGSLTPVLRRALERVGTPWWRRSTLRVFSDDASLPASAALWPSIEAALAKSKHLLLIASPTAAASPWVHREVEWWRNNRPAERLLIAVSAGEIAYDAAAGDFDWRATDCLPEMLRGAFEAEPFWTDLRFATRTDLRTLRNARFRSAALGLAAALRGVAKDELETADAVQHRRSVRAAFAGALALGVLVIAAGAATWIARTQSTVADSNRRDAESRRLAGEAMLHLDSGRIQAATALASIAWRLSPTDDARRAVERIDDTTPDVARVLGQHTGKVVSLAYSPDGKTLVTAGLDGAVVFWSVSDGVAGRVLSSERVSKAVELRFSRDGSRLLHFGTGYLGNGIPVLAVFDVATGARIKVDKVWLDMLNGALEPSSQTGRIDDAVAAISPTGAHAAVATRNAVLIVDLVTGAVTTHRLPRGLAVSALTFPDESNLRFLAHGYGDHGLRAGQIVIANARQILGSETRDRGDILGATFSADSSRVAIWMRRSLIAQLALWQVDEQFALNGLPSPDNATTDQETLAFDGAAKRIAFGINGVGRVWDIESQRMVKITRQFRTNAGPPLALSPDGHFAAALDQGTLMMWQLDGGEDERKIEGARCGEQGLIDACIQKLCQRITVQTSEDQWRELLGREYVALSAMLRGTSCAEVGVMENRVAR